jgi:isoquinoline 1-oxidoreductase beta subunit
MKMITPSRRAFMGGALLALPGAYLLGFTTPARSSTGSDILTTHFLQITPDDEIIITSPVAEIGQGTSTAYAMLVGDAMDADWERIRIELAPVDKQYVNPRFFAQMTGASTGMSSFHEAFTKAGKTARTMLIQAAARRWRVAPEEVRTESGLAIGPREGQRLRYGDLAAIASRLPEPTELIERDDDRPRFAGSTCRARWTARRNMRSTFGCRVC